MKTLKITFRFFWMYLLILFLFGCNSAEKRWEIINQSDSIPAYLSFIKEFHNNSYEDSAILKVEEKLYALSLKNDSLGSIERYNEFITNYPRVIELVDVNSRMDSILAHREKIIFLRSYESITRNETFINYEEFINKYPKIKDIIDVDKTLNLLKQRADTIEIIGKLVDIASKPISKAPVTFYLITNNGGARLTVGEGGVITNPRDWSNSEGNFKIVLHRTYLEGMNKFTLEVKNNYVETEKGIPIVIEIDSVNRVIYVGDITVK